ncbi:hypothetical protein L6164_033943 [Bauhinia variegata]|uniref:Uncharacterized protein n=1 Tax=Bauhinia variegata TaxID=167791 RepID=A0ACB9KTD8_BAUVA|nr:hypothetical protein L6164_033943 [Bauhinia variegata]
MSSSRKKLLLNTVSVNLGCSSCRRSKLSHIFHPKPKPKRPIYHKNRLYSHSWDKDDTTTSTTPTNTTTTFSPYVDSSQFSDTECYVKKSSRTVTGLGRVGGDGVAVEKDSDDPYLDFRHSMLQMILENEIYSKDDLRELLNCFLQLNSPYHHGVIVRAFTEIWNGVFSVRPSSPLFHLSHDKSRDF